MTSQPIMCSASTIYRSLTEASLKPGNWVVFPGGGGGVGIQGVQLAKAMGYRAIAIDTGDAKRELCLKMGATHFIDFKTTENVVNRVLEITDGIGAHAVIVTAAAAYKDAVAYTGVRVRSKVLCVGLRGYPSFLRPRSPANEGDGDASSTRRDMHARRRAVAVHLQEHGDHGHAGRVDARHAAGAGVCAAGRQLSTPADE